MRKRNILLGGAIATLGLLVLASCGKKDDKSNALSYDEYIAAKDGDVVEIDGYISGRCTWWGDAASFYLQDDDGGYYIYNLPCTQDQYNNDLKVGQKISVKGTKGSWSGEEEILGIPDDGSDNATWKKLSGTKTYQPVELESIEDMANHKNEFVKISVMVKTPVDSETATGPGVDLYYDVENVTGENPTTYTFCVEAYNELSQYSTEADSTYQQVLNFHSYDIVTLTGFAYTYGNLPQLHTISVESVDVAK